MNILIQGGRVIDPASGRDELADVAIAQGRILGMGPAHSFEGFRPDRVIEAQGCVLMPGLVDLWARLRKPGSAVGGSLESELKAAAAGGVTSLVCPPDTDPVLDEPGLVDMLRQRTQQLGHCRVFPLGALTRGLQGEGLTEMVELTQAGCVGFSQGEEPVRDTRVLMRALQYASTHGFGVRLRPLDAWLGHGVAASGAVATRLGLSGLPVAAETLALQTLFELVRATGARAHICRLSSAAGVALLAQAKQEGLPVTADVSVHSLHLCDVDVGYFDTRMRLNPPLRQARDRDALRQALADGVIDALVSDHIPIDADAKTLPFGEAEPGASSLELLLSLALKWGQEQGLTLAQALGPVTHRAADTMGLGLGADLYGAGRLQVGGAADLCVFDPAVRWTVQPELLHSRGKHTPFAFDATGAELPGRVVATVMAGGLAYERR
jgi:dihydroorotase